ncbi:MAG: aminopeptidase N C-terminal domain-containing protein, partial [Rubrivivax sp.]
HDTDTFNRWEAAQRVFHARLEAAVAACSAAGEEAPGVISPVADGVDAVLLGALRAVLHDPQLDAAVKALLLTVPPERSIADRLDPMDPLAVNRVREAMLDHLAQALHADWEWAFQAHQVREGYRPDGEQVGRRALANLALAMLVRGARASGDPVWPGRAYQRAKDASNLTDRLGAVEALAGVHAELAPPAIERLYATFGHDPLVLDKWFALQARVPERDGRVFARVRQLVQHPDFRLANPNRARALLFTWDANPAAFHRADAAGYVLWADKVMEIDAENPQLAAKFARALDRWRALVEPMRSAAREALLRVAASPRLSADTREIIGKALDNPGA